MISALRNYRLRTLGKGLRVALVSGMYSGRIAPTSLSCSPLASRPADGYTVDTYTGSGATPRAGVRVTILSGTNGTLPAYEVPVDGSGNFAFTYARGSGTKDVVFDVVDSIGGGRTTVTQTGYTLSSERRVKFLFFTYPTLFSGYTNLYGTSAYSNVSNNAMGWSNAAPGEFVRSGSPTEFLSTGVFGRNNQPASFRFDLPAGDYWVTATVGDQTASVTNQTFTASTGTIVTLMTGITLSAGQFTTTTFRVSTDGSGVLVIVVGCGSGFWKLQALEVRPYAAPSSLSGPGSAVGNGSTAVTISGTGARPNELVTVTATNGTITTADAASYFVGHQVLADGSGNFSFQFVPNVAASPTSSNMTAVGTTGSVNAALTLSITVP